MAWSNLPNDLIIKILSIHEYNTWMDKIEYCARGTFEKKVLNELKLFCIIKHEMDETEYYSGTGIEWALGQLEDYRAAWLWKAECDGWQTMNQ